MGVNGAGKTTLLKLVTRLYDPSEGEIAVDGVPLSEIALQELRRNIGVIFQDFARYSLTAQDNIGFGDLSRRDDLGQIDAAAAAGGATEVIEGLDHGYETILGKIFAGGTDLSGGQWQKIGMARAFMSSAPILILDEPTAALDAIAESELFSRFRRLTEGRMTFFCQSPLFHGSHGRSHCGSGKPSYYRGGVSCGTVRETWPLCQDVSSTSVELFGRIGIGNREQGTGQDASRHQFGLSPRRIGFNLPERIAFMGLMGHFAG